MYNLVAVCARVEPYIRSGSILAFVRCTCRSSHNGLGKSHRWQVHLTKAKMFKENVLDSIHLYTPYLIHNLHRLNGAKLSVFIDLALSMDDKNESSLTVAQIAEDTYYSHRRVVCALEELIKIGLVTRNGPVFVISPDIVRKA